MMKMDHSKRPGENMEPNGAPEAKKPKSEVQNSFRNGLSHLNPASKCPVCLWPIDSSKCYHTGDQPESTSRRLH